MSKKAIIIGAGVGGLATAIRLASKGIEVTVYEKNEYVGGKLSAFEKDGYFFDAGPSLFTKPSLLEELFKDVDENLSDYFTYKKIETACTYFYEDGTVVSASTDAENFANELANKLGENKETVLQYLLNSKNLYERTGVFFLRNSLHKASSFFSKKFLQAFKGVKPAYITSSLNKHNKKYFKNPKTVQLFNRFATYNGSNPFKAPAMLSVIPHLEHNDGTYYPTGGMISITNALYTLAKKKGVQFVLGTSVEKIIANHHTLKGVVVNKKNIYADIVVSNMDAYFTYKNLLQDANKASKILKQERSSSALIFYWGITKPFPQLGLHNILFSNNYELEFDFIFKKKTFYPNPTIYINITSKEEPNAFTPNACENWFVMVNVPANNGQNWDNLIPKYRQAVINKINKQFDVDIESLIAVEEVLQPQTIETKTSSYMGSLYGTSSNSKVAAFLRHPNFNYINNLYFVGGSVHPGGGIPLCLHSAKIVDDLVTKQLTKKQKH
jgi:phytoene desaturase